MSDMVAQVCGIHAQVAASAELSIGIRVKQVTRSDIRRALWQDRSLVKTYGLRGTLHLFPSRELPVWLAALRANGPHRSPNPTELDALPPARRHQVLLAIYDALADGPLTREELGMEVGQRLGSWATEEVFPAFTGKWPRWQLALRPAALEGSIV
ncbi:MAG: winged helix DNA-binding domain-containing protein, partial [Chloroflexi bacterium]|nr:winged helix DNA-binding domain-containing protein [Chloroflexota bacterium]